MATTAKGTPYVVSTDLVANYPTVSNDLATHIDNNLTYNAQTINAQTGTTYTFALADANLYKLVTATNAAASTYTVPPQSSVTWVTGNVLRILNQGAGAVTLTPGAGVTLDGSSLVLSQYQYAELHRTASNTWTVTGIATPPGMVKIVDSTFSGVTSVSINNCFTSTYANYRVTLSDTTYAASSGTTDTTFRLRASGTDNSSNNYRWVEIYGGAGGGNGQNTSATSFRIHSNLAPLNHQAVWDIFNPQLTSKTNYFSYAFADQNGSFYALLASGQMTVTTAYDGFTLISSNGNFAGTLRVYGYRN